MLGLLVKHTEGIRNLFIQAVIYYSAKVQWCQRCEKKFVCTTAASSFQMLPFVPSGVYLFNQNDQSCSSFCAFSSLLCVAYASSTRWQANSDVGSQLQLHIHLSQLEASAEIKYSWRVSGIPVGLQTARGHWIRFSSRDFPSRSQHRGMHSTNIFQYEFLTVRFL